MKRYRIGIGGAGISGLVAGLRLLTAGNEVTIVEARTRTGGRIHSLDAHGMVVETGPEFIHGNLKETLLLLDRYQIRYDRADGKMYSSHQGNLQEEDDDEHDWDELLAAMKSLERDMTLDAFLTSHFKGEAYVGLREFARGYAQGFDLADPKTASTKALLIEWENEESVQYRIPEGYGKLIQCLEDEFKKMGGKLYLGHPITNVDWTGEAVTMRLENDAILRFDKIILTIPLGLISDRTTENIFFTPAIPDKLKAATGIGFGTVVKIVTIWKSRFWEAMAPDALFFFSDSVIPTWWTQQPYESPMLTGWLGGPPALSHSEEPDRFFIEKSLQSLSEIFSVSIAELSELLLEIKIFNWKKEPWSRGAYSYSLAGQEKSKAMLGKPITTESISGVAGRALIYFAGEACYEGPYPGTVEAAVVSGLMVSKSLEDETAA